VFDEFTNSNATTVQAALRDLDLAISAVSSTTSTLQRAYDGGGSGAGRTISMTTGSPIQLTNLSGASESRALEISDTLGGGLLFTTYGNGSDAGGKFYITSNVSSASSSSGGFLRYDDNSSEFVIGMNTGIVEQNILSISSNASTFTSFAANTPTLKLVGQDAQRNRYIRFGNSVAETYALAGVSSPEGLSLADSGSIYLREDGSVSGTHAYLKTTDATSTGWIGIATVDMLSSVSSTPEVDTLQTVTNRGNSTTNTIQFAGATSVGDILPSPTLTYNLGSSSSRWNSLWAGTVNIGTSTWSMTQGSNGRLSIFDQAAGTGNERLSILNSNGNIGIGTSTPATKLHVLNDLPQTDAIFTLENQVGNFQVFNTQTSPEGVVTGSRGDLAIDSTNGLMYIKQSGTSTNTGWSTVATATTVNAFVQDGNAFGTLATLGTNDSQDLAFEVNGVERIRLGSGNTMQFTNGMTMNTPNVPSGVANSIAIAAGGVTGGGGATGGSLTFNAGNSRSAPGGSISLTSGMVFPGGASAGGAINLTTGAGSASQPGGAVNIVTGGSSGAATGGFINLTTGIGSSGAGGMVLTVGNDTGVFVYRSGASERMRLTGSGSLGIGEPSPSSRLHVDSQAVQNTAILTLENTGGNYQFFNATTSPEGSIYGSIGDIAVDSIRGRMYIKESGTSTNTGWVSFATGTGSGAEVDTLQTVTNRGATSTNGIYVQATSTFRDIIPETHNTYSLGTTSTRWKELFAGIVTIGTSTWSMTQSDNGRFSLFDAASGSGNERFTVSASGNIGIGDTNPFARLSVASTNGATTPMFSLTNSVASTTFFVSDSIPEGVITANPGAITIDSMNGRMYIKETGTSTNTGWVSIATGTNSGSGTSSASLVWLNADTLTAATNTIDSIIRSGTMKVNYLELQSSGLITMTDATSTNNGRTITLSGGTGGATSGDGGDVVLKGGAPISGKGGDIQLIASSANGAAFNGGSVQISAGTSTGAGIPGSINMVAGTGATTAGGTFSITGGKGNTLGGGVSILGGSAGAIGSGGNITIRGGYGGTTNGNGGSTIIYGGIPLGTGNGGSVSILGQSGSGPTSGGGTILLTAGSSGGSLNGAGIALTGGVGGTTGQGGTVTIQAGSGGSTSGKGGNLTLQGGSAVNGDGGTVTIRGRDAVGSISHAGGAVNIFSGNSILGSSGASVNVTAGNGGANAVGGSLNFSAGNGGTTSGSGGVIILQTGSATDGAGGDMMLIASDGAGTNDNGGSIILTAGSSSGTGVHGSFQFKTQGSSEMMRLTGDGFLGIGTSTPAVPLHVYSAATSGSIARFTNTDGSCDIDPTNSALVCSSDQSLKKNVLKIEGSLEKLMALRGVLFNWNKEDDIDEKHSGFIAQEVQAIIPGLVKTGSNGKLAVNYTGFAPYLVNALQEQQNMIQSVSSTISLLQQSVDLKKLQPAATTTFEGNIVIQAQVIASGDTVGQARIKAHQTIVQVHFAQPYLVQPIVVVTPRGEMALSQNFKYTVIDENNKGFNIKIDMERNADLDFNWHALGAGQGSTLTVSDGTTSTIQLIVDDGSSSQEVQPVIQAQQQVGPDPSTTPPPSDVQAESVSSTPSNQPNESPNEITDTPTIQTTSTSPEEVPTDTTSTPSEATSTETTP
ncbi:tail fiber domain-containing protein, partial [Candidatus Uhrbacteria bacterium]|nr:tail fiber domain-containing protein [Candidatus Uhrbacteria bacterium]